MPEVTNWAKVGGGKIVPGIGKACAKAQGCEEVWQI